MRISLNLATRPFVELRPLFARLRLAMAGLALLAVGLGFAVSRLSADAERASAAMDALKAQTLAVQQRTAANERRMRLPENQGVLQRSQFLNALFARKAFSWTAVMMDLERVLPAGVQVTSIDPEVAKDGAVTIRLRVTGDRGKAIQFVRNLEVSKRFLAPRLGGETWLPPEKAKAIGAGGYAPGLRTISANPANGLEPIGNSVEFEVFAGYNPLEREKKSRVGEGSK